MFKFFVTESGFKRLNVDDKTYSIDTKNQIEDLLYMAYTNKFKIDESKRKDLIKELKQRIEHEV